MQDKKKDVKTSNGHNYILIIIIYCPTTDAMHHSGLFISAAANRSV